VTVTIWLTEKAVPQSNEKVSDPVNP
jgi:hypothetical protein